MIEPEGPLAPEIPQLTAAREQLAAAWRLPLEQRPEALDRLHRLLGEALEAGR